MKIDSIIQIRLKKLLTIGIILLCSISIFSPVTTLSQTPENTIITSSPDIADEELYLLRVEHYLYVNASEDVGIFHIRFSFPPDYAYQVPLLLELLQ